jgi:hypothetical protein
MPLHGPLVRDPKESIERTVSILGRKVQTQTLILSGTSLAVAIALLLKKEVKQDETPRSD